jgi:MarR family transcriptional regulator, organic hydroperoxide resistance regulator
MAKKARKFNLSEAFGYLLYQASGCIRDYLGREFVRKGYPITVEEFTVLIYVWDQDGQPQRALAERLHRNKSYITRSVTHIESLGFLQRIPGKDDGREKRLFLTEKGKKLMAVVERLVREAMDFARKGVNPGEMKTCEKGLRQVIRNFA